MSSETANTHSGYGMRGDALPDRYRENWGWMLALGVALIVLGIAAFVLPVAASIAVEALVAAAMLIGGVLQGVHAWRTEGWKARSLAIVSALLYLAGAVLLFLNPLAGLVALTLVAISVILADGVLRLLMGFRMRPAEGWGWLAVSGALSIVVGIFLFALFPAISLTLLGLLLGISFVMEGVAYVALAIMARRAA